ncbi:uncharacterized protein [Antedon mediterranea]|uniref:uncharacterized protein n=1 Tax=Antedon mediterranea TaxID=105859 RepID=UPI003AF9D169
MNRLAVIVLAVAVFATLAEAKKFAKKEEEGLSNEHLCIVECMCNVFDEDNNDYPVDCMPNACEYSETPENCCNEDEANGWFFYISATGVCFDIKCQGNAAGWEEACECRNDIVNGANDILSAGDDELQCGEGQAGEDEAGETDEDIDEKTAATAKRVMAKKKLMAARRKAMASKKSMAKEKKLKGFIEAFKKRNI